MPTTPRHDRYGRPLPREAIASRQEMAASPTNRAQRERLLRRLQNTLGEHYPYLAFTQDPCRFER